LFVSRCVGDRCDMTDSDEDHDRNMRPDAEDQGWSSIDRVLGSQVIGRSSDAKIDGFSWFGFKTDGMNFSVYASKSAATVWWFGPQNYSNGFLVRASKSNGSRFIGCATKPIEGGQCGTRIEI
jgi:hypothetical protein